MFERERGSAFLCLRAFRVPRAADCEAVWVFVPVQDGLGGGDPLHDRGMRAEAEPGQGSSRHREPWGSE